MRSKYLMKTSAAMVAATIAMGAGAPAFAQIEEIVVTTRKREENLQEVPIVITAFTASAIERKGIAGLEDVAKYTSGLMLDEGANKQDTRIVIRGLSPTRGRQNVAVLQDDVDISSLAQGTAGGSFVINPRLLDMERIEVIKGPHSALFGRSAFNGAINYITRKPGDTFYGNAQVDLGTYGKAEGRVSVSGPVTDKLALGFNAAGWTFNGFYDNPIDGANLGTDDGYGGAFSFTAKPSDTLKVTGRIEYMHEDFGPEARAMKDPTFEVFLPGSAFTTAGGPVNGATVTNRSFPQVVGTLGHAKDFPAARPSLNPRTGEEYPGSNRKIFRNTLRIEADLEPVKFTSITHYGDNKSFLFNDFLAVGNFADPTVNGAQETYFDTKVKLFTQEARIQSNYESAFQWTLGGLFWREHLNQNGRSLVCVAPGGQCATVLAAVGNNFYVPEGPTDRKTKHWSGYGLGEYSITDKLKASVELRYTTESEDTSGYALQNAGPNGILGCPGLQRSIVNGLAVCNPIFGPTSPLVTGPLTTDVTSFITANVGSVFWTPRFTLDYKASDTALVYASAAMGKKPGGLNPINGIGNAATNANNTYEPEEMWVYEIGAKTSWLDNRLLVNGAIYYQDYSKKQVSISFINPNSNPPGLLNTRTVNASSASVKGFELEINAAPTDQLSLNASYTYNDGKYDSFQDISSTVSTIARAAVHNPAQACTPITVQTSATTSAVRCVIDYSGNKLEGAPKHNVVMGGELRGDVSADLGWFFDADARYQTDRFTSFENSLKMGTYWMVDLRIGLKSDKWSITGYVNNLFDDDHLKSTAVYVSNWNLSFISPRTFGVVSGASALLPDKRLFGVRANVNF